VFLEGKKVNKGKKLLSWDTEEKKETNNILGIVVFFILIIGALVYAFYYKQWSMGAVFAVLIIVFGWYLFECDVFPKNWINESLFGWGSHPDIFVCGQR